MWQALRPFNCYTEASNADIPSSEYNMLSDSDILAREDNTPCGSYELDTNSNFLEVVAVLSDETLFDGLSQERYSKNRRGRKRRRFVCPSGHRYGSCRSHRGRSYDSKARNTILPNAPHRFTNGNASYGSYYNGGDAVCHCPPQKPYKKHNSKPKGTNANKRCQRQSCKKAHSFLKPIFGRSCCKIRKPRCKTVSTSISTVEKNKDPEDSKRCCCCRHNKRLPCVAHSKKEEEPSNDQCAKEKEKCSNIEKQSTKTEMADTETTKEKTNKGKATKSMTNTKDNNASDNKDDKNNPIDNSETPSEKEKKEDPKKSLEENKPAPDENSPPDEKPSPDNKAPDNTETHRTLSQYRYRYFDDDGVEKEAIYKSPSPNIKNRNDRSVVFKNIRDIAPKIFEDQIVIKKKRAIFRRPQESEKHVTSIEEEKHQLGNAGMIGLNNTNPVIQNLLTRPISNRSRTSKEKMVDAGMIRLNNTNPGTIQNILTRPIDNQPRTSRHKMVEAGMIGLNNTNPGTIQNILTRPIGNRPRRTRHKMVEAGMIGLNNTNPGTIQNIQTRPIGNRPRTPNDQMVDAGMIGLNDINSGTVQNILTRPISNRPRTRIVEARTVFIKKPFNAQKGKTSQKKVNTSQQKVKISQNKVNTSQQEVKTSQKKVNTSQKKVNTYQKKVNTSRKKVNNSQKKFRSLLLSDYFKQLEDRIWGDVSISEDKKCLKKKNKLRTTNFQKNCNK